MKGNVCIYMSDEQKKKFQSLATLRGESFSEFLLKAADEFASNKELHEEKIKENRKNAGI